MKTLLVSGSTLRSLVGTDVPGVALPVLAVEPLDLTRTEPIAAGRATGRHEGQVHISLSSPVAEGVSVSGVVKNEPEFNAYGGPIPRLRFWINPEGSSQAILVKAPGTLGRRWDGIFGPDDVVTAHGRLLNVRLRNGSTRLELHAARLSLDHPLLED